MIVNKHNYSIDAFLASPVIQGKFKSKGIDRKRHLYQCQSFVNPQGLLMEFGVYKGKTLTQICQYWPNRTVYGFDSFEGLPEDWFIDGGAGITMRANKFDLTHAGHIDYPANSVLVKGWYEHSLQPWLAQHPEPAALIHIDCDLYVSTKTVLTLCNDRIVPGTVIVFDEFYPWTHSNPYSEWINHEYLALKEWVEHYDREFKVLLHSNHQQTSICVTK